MNLAQKVLSPSITFPNMRMKGRYRLTCRFSGNSDIQWCFSQVKGTLDDNVTEGKAGGKMNLGTNMDLCFQLTSYRVSSSTRTESCWPQETREGGLSFFR